MKPLRLLALAIAATAWLAAAAFACDGAKSASAASCGTKASATKTASASACGAHATTATVASASKKSASCAGSAGCAMSAEACKAMMASGACTPEMQAACAKGAKTAAASGCTMHSMAGHSDCTVCADEMACDDEVHASGARSQVVSLRNGMMIVYTTDGTESVRGLQAAVARHNERVIAALSGGGDLCSACKKLRGALASGKLVREVVNVERGCQLIVTSPDRAIVQQVRACTNAQVAARTRS